MADSGVHSPFGLIPIFITNSASNGSIGGFRTLASSGPFARASQNSVRLELPRDDGEPYIGAEDIDWEEPYKDGGFDAHLRLKEIRRAY